MISEKKFLKILVSNIMALVVRLVHLLCFLDLIEMDNDQVITYMTELLMIREVA